MSARTASRLAWSVCALILALIAFAVALAVANHGDVWSLTFLIGIASAALAGGLISSRRPGNLVGWLILGYALCFSLGEFSRQYAIYGLLTEPGALPLARAMASPPYWIWFVGLAFLLSLPLYFPDGRLVSRRWRPVVVYAILVAVLLSGFIAIQPGDFETPGVPNPLGIEGLRQLEQLRGLSSVLGVVLPASWLGLGVLSAASLVVRFRRSRGEGRQQIKWFTYAMVFFVSCAIFNFWLRNLSPVASNVLYIVVQQSLWAAIAVAIFRYRLYDIDVIINRSLVYGVLTATLGLGYFGGVVGLQYVFRALTGSDSQLAVVASTLAIAALFVPLRRRIQDYIDRLFYRKKYDAERTLEAFGAKLRKETDLDSLNEELVSVVRETMPPAHVSLWLREPAGDGKSRLGG